MFNSGIKNDGIPKIHVEREASMQHVTETCRGSSFFYPLGLSRGEATPTPFALQFATSNMGDNGGSPPNADIGDNTSTTTKKVHHHPTITSAHLKLLKSVIVFQTTHIDLYHHSPYHCMLVPRAEIDTLPVRSSSSPPH